MASQKSRSGPAVAGSATNGSSSRSPRDISGFAASGCAAGSATQRGSVLITVCSRSPGTGSQAIATSTCLLASPTVGSLHGIWRKRNCQSGSCSAIEGTSPRPILVWKPTTSVRLSRWASATARSAPSQSSMILRASGSSAAPAGVSFTVRRSRSKSVARIDSSSCLICLLRLGCEMNSRSAAARVKFSSSATATK